MFNPEKFLCPQSSNLSRLLNKDFPGLHLMPAGLPEWLQCHTYVNQVRTSYGAYIKQISCSDIRACYLRHLPDASEVRIARVVELAGRPFDCSELEQWASVAGDITLRIETRELVWFSVDPISWALSNDKN